MSKQPMKFDSNGIFASTPELNAIALQVLEQEKRERELRQQWFAKWNETSNRDRVEFPSWGPAMGQWGRWNISDRD